jgi:hypothetical protein
MTVFRAIRGGLVDMMSYKNVVERIRAETGSRRTTSTVSSHFDSCAEPVRTLPATSYSATI